MVCVCARVRAWCVSGEKGGREPPSWLRCAVAIMPVALAVSSVATTHRGAWGGWDGGAALIWHRVVVKQCSVVPRRSAPGRRQQHRLQLRRAGCNTNNSLFSTSFPLLRLSAGVVVPQRGGMWL
jgi:hypothetical protein